MPDGISAGEAGLHEVHIRKADEIGPSTHSRALPGSGKGTDAKAVPAALLGPPAARGEAQADLRTLLLRGARFELGRSRDSLPAMSDVELDALATEAAEDALAAVLARLDGFRGASRFSTWASKFALHEARLKREVAEAGR